MKKLYLRFALLLCFILELDLTAQKDFSLELGARAYGFEQGLLRSGFGLNVEKHFANDFSLNYHLSFGTMDVGKPRNAFSMHMPAGTLLGCVLAAYASGSGTLELVPYCFLIPEGVTYYPVRNEQMDIGLTADLLGVNYSSEKSQFVTSKFSYQQNFGAVFKFKLPKDKYISARIGYQVDYYFQNTLRGFNAGVALGFRD